MSIANRYYDEVSDSWIPKGTSPDLARKTVAGIRMQETNSRVYGGQSYEKIWYNGQVLRENRKDVVIAGHSNYVLAGVNSSAARNTYNEIYSNVIFLSTDLPSWHKFPSIVVENCINYSLKIGTNTTWCKTITTLDAVPAVPDSPLFYLHSAGVICTSNEYIEGDYDIYFAGSPDAVEAWAAEKGLIYPCPSTETPWIYSAVYENFNLVGLKAYVEHGY